MKQKKEYSESEESGFSKLKSKVVQFFNRLSAKFRKDPQAPKKTKKKLTKQARNEMIFCISLIAFPIFQWCVIDLAMKVSNLFMMFKTYDLETGTMVFLPKNDLFRNFKDVLGDFFDPSSRIEGLSIMLRNSLMVYLLSQLVWGPLTWVLAYLFSKKLPGSKIMHVIFSIPSALSGLVVMLVFRILLERTLPAWGNALFHINNFPNLLGDTRYMVPTILFYMTFSSLGGANIVMVSQMSRIPKDVFEYGRLEGISMWQEFVYVVIPNIWGLLTVNNMGFLVAWINCTMPAFELYGEYADISVQTLGYYMYIKVIGARSSAAYYGYTTAYGMLLALITIPATLLGRKILSKIDPEAEY